MTSFLRLLRTYSWVLASGLLVLSQASIARAATAEQIDQALKRGAAALYKLQTATGHWENAEQPTGPGEAGKGGHDTEAAQWTGRTAIAVYALLASGEDKKDPRIVKAVEFLAKNETHGVYALGLRCQVWMLMPQTPAIRTALMKDVNILKTGMKTEGLSRGMYDYVPGKAGGKSYSHSRSQYAVQGFWAAQTAGAELPDSLWKIIDESWKRNQGPDGGWTYKAPSDNDDNHPETVGLTAVGVATLFIAQDFLRSNEGIACRGNQTNPAIEKGLAWIATHANDYASHPRGSREYPYPTLYAVERIGMASGLAYFGSLNWFNNGADWAIREQNSSGTWDRGDSELPNTCFAMLFLSKGRAPVVISKLKYTDATGKEGNWNQRGRDAANVSRWIGKTLERDLAWQIVTLDVSIEDLLESPILYISGNEPVNFSPEHKAKLKAFIEAGGMLVANADCGSAAFATSIRKLGFELFPDYEFGELPKDDILLTNYYPAAKWKTKPSILRLSNGARPFILLLPQTDAGKSWQTYDQRGKPELFELAADVVLYAVDNKKMRYRGSRFYVPEPPKASNAIAVTRIKYPGVWDPEPAGWKRLSNVMTRTKLTGVTTTTAELGKDQVTGAKIAHLTGTFDYKFSDAQKAEIKQFVAGGGTLIVDVAGGSGKVATSFEGTLADLFPGEKLEVLPPEHPLYSAGGGAKDEIAYRSYAIRNGVGQTTSPRLQGIQQNGRLAVIYSREDLSVGLVGQEVDGVIGYTPATATALMTRILTYAAGQ